MDAESAIGARIEALRKARGWSRHLLAEKAGVTREAIRLIETGGRSPMFETVERIALALGLTLDELRHGAPVEARAS